MDPAIAVHFHSQSEHVQRLAALQKEATTLLGNLTKAQMFQDSQRRNLINHLKRNAEASNGAAGRAEEIQQLQQRIASDKQTIAKLQQEHDRLITIISNSLHQRQPGSHPSNEMSPSVSMVSLAPSNTSRASKSSGVAAARPGSMVASGSSHRSSIVFQVEPAAGPTQEELQEQRNKVVSRMLMPNFKSSGGVNTSLPVPKAIGTTATQAHAAKILTPSWTKKDPLPVSVIPTKVSATLGNKGPPAKSSGLSLGPRVVHAGTATGAVSSLRQLGTTSRATSGYTRMMPTGNKYVR
ncbi:mucin-1-like isoform X2 [Paramacrobiotus metropolitanus]|nr:mucin-1-like isoform X2 [Paramacrobiotus metropolitanus]